MDMRLPAGVGPAAAPQQPPLRLLQRWQPQPGVAQRQSAPSPAAALSWRDRLQQLFGR